ncbi:DUF1648 domain-containing protein [Streptococcus sanguinis]|uniref:DUF1648 domain-containing protein n=1 Tax=Streptococcus sanguinis SK115 TaxID=888810 RepID=F0I7P8_STRSA|nr:DUF1648 domain-containing protein [Streptococcus sanguinis]EGD32403.1 hypothetical protein HMPREF9382_1357 [Streptococcus sanguinis SK115]MBZ2052856.1 DUF1648 domain-containing protein [Streptococcus sanguinis]MCY7012054.1 DUF1648 domain-containing protein [Streptococcus sanguinis]
MKKKDLFVLFLLAVTLFLIICLLPEQVPIHFNSAGKADIVVNRFCLIISLPIPYSLYWKYFRNKSKRGH